MCAKESVERWSSLRLQSDGVKVSEYYSVVHGYTTTARPLSSTLPGLQGLGWAKYVVGSSVAAVIY